MNELTEEQKKEIKAKELRVGCPRCKNDISEQCQVFDIQIPMGRDKFGQVIAMQETLVIVPLICPFCGLSMRDRPSPVQTSGVLLQ